MATVSLRELTDENRRAVLSVRVAPTQERFVGTVAGALQDAEDFPEARPWYRAVYAGGEPVGFLMLSWNVTPDPPRIIGPWFLWKLIVDERHQGRGYGREIVELAAGIARDNGAAELLTSCVPGDDGPEPFYRHIGFALTGDVDDGGEVILALPLS
jgi:diamine N-acetyltransferase